MLRSGLPSCMEEQPSAVGLAPSSSPAAAAKSWVVPPLEALAALPQLHALPAEPHPAADPYELFCFITAARRCLLAPGAPPPPAALLALLAREAGSLRSAMARGALTCACELGERWRAGVAFPAAAALVGALVARCANSADKRFIRDLALLALQRCALAQPCSEMLLHLLSLEAVGRNRAAALVVATVADACVGGVAAGAGLFASAGPPFNKQTHLAHPAPPLSLLAASCGRCPTPALAPLTWPRRCRAWRPSSPAAAPLRAPWQCPCWPRSAHTAALQWCTAPCCALRRGARRC